MYLNSCTLLLGLLSLNEGIVFFGPFFVSGCCGCSHESRVARAVGHCNCKSRHCLRDRELRAGDGLVEFAESPVSRQPRHEESTVHSPIHINALHTLHI